MAAFKARLATIGFRAARRVHAVCLQVRPVVEQGVIPRTAAFIGRTASVCQRGDVAVCHLGGAVEKLVDKHSAHIRLDVNIRLAVCKDAHAGRRGRTYPRQGQQLVFAARHLASKTLANLAGGAV